MMPDVGQIGNMLAGMARDLAAGKGIEFIIEKLKEGRNQPRSGFEFPIIGDNQAGKTTYLAALAYWPRSLHSENSPILSIEPYDNASGQLVTNAENLLKQGDDLPRSTAAAITYALTIELKLPFVDDVTRQPIKIKVRCTDYPGEMFNDNTISQKYLDQFDCAKGFMLLIDPTQKDNHRAYAQAIRKLESSLDAKFNRDIKRMKEYRIACVFSKSELSDVWGTLDDSDPVKVKEYMRTKFQETYYALTDWERRWQCKIQYFSCSAFGWTGTNSKPNSREIDREGKGVKAVIRDAENWTPAGLVQPIYWLYTGKPHRGLRNHNL